jgi:di/tricarboxylate transporter
MPHAVSADLIVTLAVLAIAMVALLTERLSPDLVALLVVVTLGVTGVLSPQETFSGFSQSAVITILAIFILAEGLRRAGVADRVGDLISRLAGKSERRLIVVVMLAGSLLSLVMNNIAAAAVLLPAVTAAGRRARVSPSRLLMPLAFSTLLGGMATLLTTANIVSSSLLQDHGFEGFGLLDFLPLGLSLVICGTVYVALVGRRWLPEQAPQDSLQVSPAGDLVEIYRLRERLFRARVPAGSYLVGRPVAGSMLRETYKISLVAVEREGRLIQSPPPDLELAEGDVLHFQGDLEDFRRRDVEPYLDILPERSWREADLESRDTVVVEAILAPRASLVGRTLREARFRHRYGMTALAIWRGDQPIVADLGERRLAFGDALLLQGPRDRLGLLRDEPDLIVLSREEGPATRRPAKHWQAVAVLVATLAVAVATPLPIGEVMLGGALAMVLLGLLTMEEAYQAIEWRTVFLVAGMLPLGIALTKSGAAALLAHGLATTVGSVGPTALLVSLLGVTTLLVQAMNGPAVAAVMVPIAITVAGASGVDPRSLVMGVALATSTAFLTPLGHPVNLLVMGSGGYGFRDYWRLGWPLAVLVLALVVLLLPVVWPLR